MRRAIEREFGEQQPRAIVLDDSARARKMTARRLRRRGFVVDECSDFDEFKAAWSPGTIDVIISDWDLSHDEDQSGENVLKWVRKQDWDVPFVLVSGKLDEAAERAPVLAKLLSSGGARFITRGSSGIERACNAAEDLIERRDLALLKMILAIRPAALNDVVVVTSSGHVSARDQLKELVAKPAASHDAGRPIAAARSRRAVGSA